MKKIYFILLLSLIGLCFNSCVNEEDDLFDKSAARRMNEAIAKYKAILQDNPQGWVMEFYPADRSMGGYTYTAKFDNGKVDMTSELSLYNDAGDEWPAGTVVTSYYRIISEQSAILTFDTYNLLFHFFSEPRGSDDVDGYASDYEFVFMEVSENHIVLKGKKYGNKMVMTKLTENAQSYIQKVLDMQEKLESVPRLKMIVGGKEYAVRMGGKLLSYTDTKEDNSLENIDMAYIYTPEGINLYEPITVNGISFQSFVYEDATGILKAKDADVTFPYPTALEQFCGTTSQWNFSFDLEAGTGEMNQELMDLFSSANDTNWSSQSELFIDWFIGANPAYPGNDTNPMCMGWVSDVYGLGIQQWRVCYGYELSIEDESARKISFHSTNPGLNYEFYEFLEPVIKYVDTYSPYTVEFDDNQKPTKAKMVSTVNNNVWFSVAKR